MATDEMKAIMEMKSDIASIKGILSTMANTNEMAIKAFESAASAHHRLNKMEKDVSELQKGQNWLPKLITSCVLTGLFGGLIGFAITKL